MIKIILSSIVFSLVGSYLLLSLFFGGCSALNEHASYSLGVWKSSGDWQCVESNNPYRNKKC